MVGFRQAADVLLGATIGFAGSVGAIIVGEMIGSKGVLGVIPALPNVGSFLVWAGTIFGVLTALGIVAGGIGWLNRLAGRR